MFYNSCLRSDIVFFVVTTFTLLLHSSSLWRWLIVSIAVTAVCKLIDTFLLRIQTCFYCLTQSLFRDKYILISCLQSRDKSRIDKWIMSNNPIFYILNHLAAPTLRDFTTVMTVTVAFPNHIVIWLVVEDQGQTVLSTKTNIVNRESRKQKSKKNNKNVHRHVSLQAE